MSDPSCWLCGNTANSKEHIFKASDLRRIFKKDGYLFKNLPFHFGVGGSKRVAGPKAENMKYPALICAECNTKNTSDFDKAYEKISEWMILNSKDINGQPPLLSPWFK